MTQKYLPAFCHPPQPKKIQKTNIRQDIPPEDTLLLSKLKQLRLQIANKKQVPAFVIFADKTLIDMCIKKPLTKQDFLAVNGVGEQKCYLIF